MEQAELGDGLDHITIMVLMKRLGLKTVSIAEEEVKEACEGFEDGDGTSTLEFWMEPIEHTLVVKIIDPK